MTQSSFACGATVIGLSGCSRRSPRSYRGRKRSTFSLGGTIVSACECVRKAPSAEIASGRNTRRSSATRYAMSVVSSASCDVSTQQSSHPRSRTTSASLCSTPNAPGSSSARLPTSATIGTRSGGVTTRHSIAYIQPTPDEPQNTRAPTVDACFTISNWLCSPSATMYSAPSWPLAIFFPIACMPVSYGRIGYAVTTSRSARASASATASLPEIRSSLSSPAAVVAVAIAIGTLLDLLGGILARNACHDLDAAALEILLQLLVVLAAEAETMRAGGRLLVADRGGEPGLVGRLVFPPHLPLAGVVVED